MVEDFTAQRAVSNNTGGELLGHAADNCGSRSPRQRVDVQLRTWPHAASMHRRMSRILKQDCCVKSAPCCGIFRKETQEGFVTQFCEHGQHRCRWLPSRKFWDWRAGVQSDLGSGRRGARVWRWTGRRDCAKDWRGTAVLLPPTSRICGGSSQQASGHQEIKRGSRCISPVTSAHGHSSRARVAFVGDGVPESESWGQSVPHCCDPKAPSNPLVVLFVRQVV